MASVSRKLRRGLKTDNVERAQVSREIGLKYTYGPSRRARRSRVVVQAPTGDNA